MLSTEKNLKKLGYYRVASVTPKLKIADPGFNISVMFEIFTLLEKHNPDFVLFPELNISGYTCGDLFYSQQLRDDVLTGINTLLEFSTNKNYIIICGAPLESNGKLFNTAVVIQKGRVLGVIPKTYLCNNSEYYEERWFSSEFDRITDSINLCAFDVPFGADLIFESIDSNFRFGIEICEDLWAVEPVSSDLAIAGACIIFNLSASNEYLGKYKYRKELVINHSARLVSAYVYSASGPWESTSDTVFSGNCLIAENGKLLAETKRFGFENDFCIADIDISFIRHDRLRNNSYGILIPEKQFRTIRFQNVSNENTQLFREYSKTPFVPDNREERSFVCNEILEIQSTALARRFLQTKSIIALIGISGGLDSTLALIATAKAFKKINLKLSGIIGVTMPGPGTSLNTKNNALLLGNSFGITTKIIGISDEVNLHLKKIEHNSEELDITFENVQARIRTMTLMNLANKYNGIVIGTGDLSEIALGWNTFNGDHMAMYNVNSGVPKTLVKYIIEWYAQNNDNELGKVLKSIIDTPISPELLPTDNKQISQKTEDIIGPYILHDFFLYYTVRCGFTKDKILFIASKAFENNFKLNEIETWYQVFINRFNRNQFKRNVVPDGVKIGTVNLSPRADWRMPSDAY